MSWKQPKYSQQHKLRILPALHVYSFEITNLCNKITANMQKQNCLK